MSDSGELRSLLERGLELKEEILRFVKRPSLTRELLTTRITEFIRDIEVQLPEPSSTENTETCLKAICLGSIKKNLIDIKPIIQSPLPTPRHSHFFKIKIQADNLAMPKTKAIFKLSDNLNQLENILNQSSDLRTSLAPAA